MFLLLSTQKRIKMSVANRSNYSLMYKSKSGRHLNATKERIKDEKKQNRLDRRLQAFQRNRLIEPTPKKVIDTATDEGIGSFSTISHDETEKNSKNVQKNVSKQQVFKQRFVDYMKKKEEQKAHKFKNAAKSKPFVSTVPSGKIVEVDKIAAVKRNVNPPVKRTKLAISNPIIPICDTPHHRSPINTRSKKLKLVPMMSMEQLTPKRNRRKSVDVRKIQIKPNALNPALSRPGTSGRRLSANKNLRVKIVNNSRTTSGAIKKVMRATQPPNMVAKPKVNTKTTTTSVKVATATKKTTTVATNTKKVLTKNGLQPKVAVKPNTSKALPLKPSNSKQAENKLNPPEQLVQFMKSPKIPTCFKFGTSNWQLFNGGVASTAVKSKVKQNSTSSPKILFNESFSPIEDDSEAKQESSSAKRRSKIHKTPKSMSAINEQFVSPFVKIARKLPTITVSDAPTVNETTVTMASDEKERTPIQKTEILTNKVNYVSPFVTVSRGNRRFSAKKEAEARESIYKLDSRKSLDFNESVTDRQHREAAAYFHLQVQRETDRFNALCDKWSKYVEENKGTDKLPEENVDQINVALGQTGLLLRSKFKQFSTLVEQCADTTFTPKVKPQDLEGFWSLVRIQVDKLIDRFDRLDKLEQNQWQDPSIELVKVKKIRDIGIKKTKAKPKRLMNSALAEMLKAARKNQKEIKNNGINSENGNDIMFLTKRKSLLSTSNLNSSKTRRSLTPSKVPWTVSIR